MKSYDNLLDALEYLKGKGFDAELKIDRDGVFYPTTQKHFSHKNLSIKETIKVESDSDSDYTSFVYAIEMENGAVKGTIIDATGAYSEFSIDR